MIRKTNENCTTWKRRKYCDKRCSRLGKGLSRETIEKIKKNRRGKGLNNKNSLGIKRSNEFCEVIRKRMLGNSLNPGLKGEDSPNWRGGRACLNTILRGTYKQKMWRRAVFIRDNFTCQSCGKVGGTLNAHHIKSFSEYPEDRTDINNGITLCLKCHKLTENYAGRTNKIFRHESDKKDIQPKEKD